MKTKILQLLEKYSIYGIIGLIGLGLIIILFGNITSIDNQNIKDGEQTTTTSQILGAKTEPTWKEIEKVGVNEGWTESEMQYINNYCSTQNNPKWCAMLAVAIADAETGTCQRGVGRVHKNNCFSMTDGNRELTYTKRIASFEDWVESYNEFWYKNTCSDMVYRSNYVSPNATQEQKENWINNCELTIVKFYN